MKNETNIFNTESLHHNCLVQVWSNSQTGETSPGWKYDEERVEQILAYVCDELCQFPQAYKDPDDLWTERCDRCRLRELLEEEENGS